MNEKGRNIVPIDAKDLVQKVQQLKDEGYRMVQIHCTKVNGFELSYSFDKDHELLNLRVVIAEEEEIMSITGIYWAAFIYENEIQDLFGVKFLHMVLNYNGNFFKTAQKTPWNPRD